MTETNTQLVMIDDDAPAPAGKFVADVAAPGEVDGAVKKRRTRKLSAEPKAPRTRRTRGQAGTKLQTQVPKEWRDMVTALAKAQDVREADVIRGFIARGLGIDIDPGT